MIYNRYKHKNLEVLLKRYILIFTLALISCAGTNYIHSLTTQVILNNDEVKESSGERVENKKDVVGVKEVLSVKKFSHLI